MAAIFIAQATNVPLSLGQQLSILGVLLLTSKGAAAVTGGGFITLAATLSTTGTMPVAGLALLLGIDRFMSEARAITNLIGNGVATMVVARWEGALDLQRLSRGAESPDAKTRRPDPGRGSRARGARAGRSGSPRPEHSRAAGLMRLTVPRWVTGRLGPPAPLVTIGPEGRFRSRTSGGTHQLAAILARERVLAAVASRENSRKRRGDFACNFGHRDGYDDIQSAGGPAVTACRHAAGRISAQPGWKSSRAFEQDHESAIGFRGDGRGLPDPG